MDPSDPPKVTENNRLRNLLMLLIAYTLMLHIWSSAMAREPDYTLFVFGWIVMFALFLASIRVFGNSRHEWVAVGIGAVALRLVLLDLPPVLSSDIYRYIWDANLFDLGINPFQYAPDSPVVAALDNGSRYLINHPQMHTIYPPLAQVLFLGAYKWSPTIPALKFLFVLFDLGIFLLIARRLRRIGEPVQRAAIYGLFPLVVVESAFSGHLDYAAVFFLLLAVLNYEREREIAGHVALAVSILIKFVPIILLPVVITRSRNKRRLWIIPALLVLGYLPFVSAGKKLLTSLVIYCRHWNFNPFLFDGLAGLTRDPLAARIAAGLILVAVIAWCTWKRLPMTTAALVILGAWILLTTTVHPWILIWVLPFAILKNIRAFLYLGFAAGLTYYAQISLITKGVWHLPGIIRWIEYLPFTLLLIAEIVVIFSARQHANTASNVE